MTTLLACCVVLSGAAALALEMLWMRSAGLVVGQTAMTAATILACYFAGLAGGAFAARTVGERPLRAYGSLEIGAALAVVWSVGIFRLATIPPVQRWLAAAGSSGAVGLLALATVPATMCFGATLPVLGRAVEDSRQAGQRSALFYALNTVGGVLGISAAGFGLPALVGVDVCYALVAVACLLAGVAALAIDGSAAGRRRVAEPVVDRRGDTPRRRLCLIAGGAGALALGLEIAWVRLFAQVLHNSVYSFAAVLLVYIFALAAGGALAGAMLRRAPAARLAGAALLGAAVASLGGFWLFIHITEGLAYVGMRSGLVEYLLRIVAIAAMCAGPAGLASGVVLPALWTAWGSDVSAARSIGPLSAANALGGIAGALTVGFLVIPNLGVRGALLAVVLGYIVLADVTLPRPIRWRWLGYAALLLVVLADPLRAPLVNLRAGETLRSIAEGASGVVSVVETPDDLQLRLDNFYVLGGRAAASNERRLGLVPLLLHPDPHRALFVGLATGISASAGAAANLDETTVVEVVPEVAAAARAHFGDWNGGLLDRRDVRLIIDDGRRFLTATEERFDVIVSDLFVPWHAGAGSLYAREMYEAAAAHLTSAGVFCQWLPLYQLTREEFDLIARTFLTVFPVTTLWRADFYPDRPVIGLVGQLIPQRLDLARVGARLERLPAWSRDALLATPRGLALLYVGDLGGATDLLPGETINSDDRPLLEFDAPRLTRINAAGDKDWFSGAALADFVDAVAARDRAPDPFGLVDADSLAARRAGRLLYRYALAAAADAPAAAELAAAVRHLVPEVVAAAEPDDAVGTLADARRSLAALRSEQEEVRQQLELLQQRLGALAQTSKAGQ